MAEQGKCKNSVCKCHDNKVGGCCSDPCTQGKKTGDGKCECRHPACVNA